MYFNNTQTVFTADENVIYLSKVKREGLFPKHSIDLGYLFEFPTSESAVQYIFIGKYDIDSEEKLKEEFNYYGKLGADDLANYLETHYPCQDDILDFDYNGYKWSSYSTWSERSNECNNTSEDEDECDMEM